MDSCDVTICGAGISGLLLASELSKSLSVIVLEKAAREECSNKFWLTRKKCVDLNPELRDCVDSEWEEIEFISNSRERFCAVGSYTLWNTKRLESKLLRQIAQNGSAVHYKHRFYSYKYVDDAIESYANARAFRSHLLIDCMGYASPIVHSSNSVDILGYYHLYGQVTKLTSAINPVALDNVILSGRPSYLEIFPRSDGKANVVLIAPAKTTQSIEQLQTDFEFIIDGSHYADRFARSVDDEMLYGIVPIGIPKRLSLDRILFFGEAAQLHPASSCTCLDRLLMSYKRVSQSVANTISARALSAKDIAKCAPYKATFSDRFHRNMYQEMAAWRSEHLPAFIELLRCTDPASLEDFIFGDADFDRVKQLKGAWKVMQKRNFLWVRPLMRSIFSAI